ncbi:PREDICTED: exostosin-2-like [Priapulus caudatus]|uniref:Exostosin-2-like n=1 Tax=Priapulus caudatus TaxID=37621 RepID=A0ABM1DPH4_PRICU|nr:PREDICTED: exostosin-2-like [Priapulus caudatus]
MGQSSATKQTNPWPLGHRFSIFYLALLGMVIIVVIAGLYHFWPNSTSTHHDNRKDYIKHSLENAEEVVIPVDAPIPKKGDISCTYNTCFDVYKCGYNDDYKISIYIYPFNKYVDDSSAPITSLISREFHEILTTIAESEYFTTDPNKACIFVPSIDMLNQNNLRLRETAQALQSLPYWNEGLNHLLFNMMPGSIPDYNTALDVHRDKAMVAGGGFSTWTYRRDFDVSIPVYNPLLRDVELADKPVGEQKMWLAVASQVLIHSEYRQELSTLAEEYPDMLVLDRCSSTSGSFNYSQRCQGDHVFDYPQILQESTFCVVLRGARLGQAALVDAMKSGCIPVIVADTYVLPFSEVLDWKRAALTLYESELSELMEVLHAISETRVVSMRRQLRFLYQSYFSSIKRITETTLRIVNDRVFPYAGRKSDEWNTPTDKPHLSPPLFLPLIAPKAQGFTAVVLTYDRVHSLFEVINRVAAAPSLSKVLVVWNNQNKDPPQTSMWPRINKPLKVVQTRANKLSNRFYPYDEIETEAILAIDDDIVMLTADELEFGYQVWREFPDRLVGFPSRLNLWDNNTQKWKYESEWTSEISMVLTGAAFYHKYYSFLYTTAMPGNIKEWVDDHMNCEDIAMNFLIANLTGKPTMKVAPRQKFKCPECTNVEISADLAHMVERTECINLFSQIYGRMPLKTVEFRADPVLYKENVPDNLKKYKDIGSL